MQMIRQNANRDHFKGPAPPNGPVDPPQAPDLTNEKVARTVRKNDGEEEKAALDLAASISGHAAMLPRLAYVRTPVCLRGL